MQDSWCQPAISKHGVPVSGGAARNVRIAALGGMDKILQAVAYDAAQAALVRADLATQQQRKKQSHLRLVKIAA